MRSDDLVPLLAGGTGKTLGIRQGVLTAWNPDTLENLVTVGGAVLQNLPITVNPSDLHAGDVVILESLGASFAIRGRILYPNTPEALNATVQSVTNRIQAAADVSAGTRNSTTFGDLAGTGVGPAVTIRIGSSGRALVFWGAEIGQTGVLMSDLNPHVGVEVSGASTVAANVNNALNFEFFHSGGVNDFQAWWQAGTFHLFTGLNSGSTTFTLKYAHQGITPSTNITFQAREIAVFAL